MALLACGADRWNSFRREHPEFLVITGASLPDAQLAHADLQRTILMESDLRRANLTCASLQFAVLRKSDFSDSDMRQAKMDGADLFCANLAGADLREASLVLCFLKRADLRGADLSTARGLTDIQIGETLGDRWTRLPGGITRPETWAI